MSARDDLLMELVWDNTHEGEARANALLDAFAHELAEQIREWTKEDGGAPEYGSVENVLDAADRIDPYANGAGPVRPDEEPTT